MRSLTKHQGTTAVKHLVRRSFRRSERVFEARTEDQRPSLVRRAIVEVIDAGSPIEGGSDGPSTVVDRRSATLEERQRAS